MPTTINLENVLMRGLRSAQPAAGVTAEGTLYFVTDEGVTEQVRSATWVTYSNTVATIGSGQIVSGLIASGQVGGFHLSSGCVTSGRIASGQVGAFHLSSGSVVSGRFASGAVGPFAVASGMGQLIATQAELEAAASLVAPVTPGRQQYHPSAVKAWCSVDCTGTVTILGSYNISSVADNGVGDFTFNFSTSFSSTTYTALMSQTDDTGAGINAGTVVGHTGGKATGSFRVDALNSAASAFFDSDDLFAAFLGDQ